MCYTLKYGIWKWNEPGAESVNGLVSGGYPPLVAMVLASRGINTPEEAREYLACDKQLADPFRLRDMDKAAARVAKALAGKEKICVFGDYDVDGITATCPFGAMDIERIAWSAQCHLERAFFSFNHPVPLP